jgi:NAD(P)H-hydrate repair Nnr-like enzyme with NAD(P)H-hydrate dehydratase domain
MVQTAPVPVLSSAEARRWEAGLLKNHEQEWAAMPAVGVGLARAQEPSDLLPAACRGVVWPRRAADLLARTHGQVAIEIYQIFRAAWASAHSTA